MNFDITTIAGLLLGAFELFVRIKPTTKNYSILHLATTIIDAIFPNRKKNKETFSVK